MLEQKVFLLLSGSGVIVTIKALQKISVKYTHLINHNHAIQREKEREREKRNRHRHKNALKGKRTIKLQSKKDNGQHKERKIMKEQENTVREKERERERRGNSDLRLDTTIIFVGTDIRAKYLTSSISILQDQISMQ